MQNVIILQQLQQQDTFQNQINQLNLKQILNLELSN